MKITYNISFYIHESVTNREIFIKTLADTVLGKTLSYLYGMGKNAGNAPIELLANCHP